MARQPQFRILKFPIKGIDVTVPRTEQDETTCANCLNVRVFDPLEGRARGGIRPGLAKYCSSALNGTNRVQALNVITIVNDATPNTSSLSLRTVKPMGISQGVISTFNTTTVTNATAAGSRSISATAPFVLTAGLFDKVYCTDGISYKIWDASDNTTSDWTPTAGSLPGTDGTTTPRLIAMWRSRMVLSGLRSDPHNWFMAAVGDPLDWDTAPSVPSFTQAVAGGVGIVGKSPDKINCLIPYSDDVLIFGCDHSIYALSGDPQYGGQIDLVSDTMGVAFGKPWCRDSFGNVYFFSSRGNICRIEGKGGAPVPLTKNNIQPELKTVNLDTHFINMEWDENDYGVHVWITPFSAGSTDHWFYDFRVDGFFRDSYANNNHNPMTTTVFDGDDPDDRKILIGSEDGFVRFVDDTASDDDGTDISSFVIIGPISDKKDRKEMILAQMQMVMDLNSGAILYEVMTDDTPEGALLTEEGTFTGDGSFSGGGKTPAVYPRDRGYYFYVKLGNTASSSSWAFEYVNAKFLVITTDDGRDRSDTQ